MIRNLFKDLTKYLPSYIVPFVIGIISIPIITRLIPPEEYGNYVLVLAAVSVLSAVGTTWLSSSSIRFFPSYELDKREGEFFSVVIKLIFVSVMSILLIALFVLFFTRSFISSNLYSLLYIGILLFVTTSVSDVFLSILMAKRKASWYSFIKIWHCVIGFIIGIILIVSFHWGAKGLLSGAFLSMAMALPFLYKLAIGKISFKKGNILSPITLKIAKYGFPIVAINLTIWILMLSDRYILNFFMGSKEVGIYSVGYTIPERTLLVIAILFQTASSPISFKIWEKEGVKASQAFLAKLTRYYLLIALPATVGLSVLSEPVMHVFASPSYFSGYQVIPIISFSLFFVGIIDRFNNVMTYRRKTNLIMFNVLFAAILNLGLNFLFIPKYGYMAAALTTFIAFAVNMIVAIIISRHLLVWVFPFKSLVKIAIASAVMGMGIHYLVNHLISSNLLNLIVGVCSGIVIYFVMLILLCEFQHEEIEEGRKLLSLKIFKSV